MPRDQRFELGGNEFFGRRVVGGRKIQPMQHTEQAVVCNTSANRLIFGRDIRTTGDDLQVFTVVCHVCGGRALGGSIDA
ncbi:MAG: hypothetical protein AAGA25_07085 [Planctomycetota bacterium]